MSKLNSLKNLYHTYISTIHLAWEADHRQFTIIFVTSALSGLLTLPQLLANKQLIDIVAKALVSKNISNTLQPLIVVSLVILLINFFRGYFSNINGVYSGALAQKLSEKVVIKISRKINTISTKDAESPTNRNTLQKVIDNTGRSIWNLIMPLAAFPETFFNIVSNAFILINYNILLLVPGILFSLPNIIVGVKYSRARHKFRSEKAPLWRLWTAFEDFTTKGRYLYENKILDHFNHLLNRRQKLADEIFSKQLTMDKKFSNQRHFISIPNNLFDTVMKILLYYQAILGSITLGTAQIVSNSLGGFISNVSYLIRNGNDIYQNYLFVKDYEDFMALPDEISTSTDNLPEKLTTGIEFRDVWFKYPSSKNWILKGVSFKVDPTDNIAIVGVNGAGKSTLVKLLCRFYQPEKGEILVNGKNINDYDLKNYYHSIAALFQDFAQYPFSAKDNIRFGAIFEKSSRKKIKHAADLAGIDHFIASLPLGYDNPLDKEFKDGIEPSKGQWQRIALARTLYRNSPIVILDEPTSNVDPESEEEIFNKILSVAADKSVILISHRFNTVKIADQILILEDGVITQQGSHEQLMKQHGSYHRLFTLQAKSYTS